MKKAILYKEWIKTHRYFWLALIVSSVFVIYALLQLQRVIGFKGVEHLWEILLSRETVFIELLTYVPLAIGVLLALVQFVPEIQQKRLKLTLHLPYPQRSMIGLMLAAGLVQLLFALARGVHGGGDAAAPTFGVPFQGGMPGLIRRRCCRALKRLLLLKRF